MKPANYKENRRDRRLAKNQNGKRQVVVVRERDGRTLPAVFKSESATLGLITPRVAKGNEIVADEAGSWTDLRGRYSMQRIDHQAAYSDRGVHSNNAVRRLVSNGWPIRARFRPRGRRAACFAIASAPCHGMGL